MSLLFDSGDMILFMGDSITDAGRARPLGEGDGKLGSGYVANIAALLAASCPEHPLRIINQGVSGDTVRQLVDRWGVDVIAHKPEWLSLMIGINDVWRQFDQPMARDRHVLPMEFEHSLSELLQHTRRQLKGLILMTPFFLETNMLEAMRQRVEQYAAIIRKLARRFEATLVDTQSAFDEMLRHYQSYRLSHDRVHPNDTGHMVLARTWLSAVGYRWSTP